MLCPRVYDEEQDREEQHDAKKREARGLHGIFEVLQKLKGAHHTQSLTPRGIGV